MRASLSPEPHIEFSWFKKKMDTSLLQTFLSEVAAHKESIDILESEGQELNPQASPEDQTMVNRLVGDVNKRYDDLNFTLEEREVQLPLPATDNIL